MNQKNVDRYKKLLIREKLRLEQELERLKGEETLSQKESTGELSSYDNHPGDDGTITFDREMDQGIKDNAFAILKQVYDALNKIEEGEYGVCQSCGKEIKDTRLEIVPYSSFCEECKEIEEGREGVRERPLAEESFYPPFRGSNDKTGDVEYDAEDAWQDVAQYGTSNDPMYDPDSVTGESPSKETYVDSKEVVGSVGIEDSIIDDKEDDDTKTTFTGIKKSNKR